ncbi:hypothetical protein Tco_0848147 [Tanacetum coccineum]
MEELMRMEGGKKEGSSFRVDVKRKFIEDKVRREKVFEVDEALDIENLRASSFHVRGIHVDETKVNAVWDWSSPQTLPTTTTTTRTTTVPNLAWARYGGGDM